MLMQAGPFSRHDAELIQVLFVTYEFMHWFNLFTVHYTQPAI